MFLRFVSPTWGDVGPLDTPKTPPRRFQDASKTPPRRLHDSSKTPPGAFKTTSRASKMRTRASKTPPKRCCSKKLLPCQVHAKSLPSPCQFPKYARNVSPRWPSTMADCQIRGRLAVVRPRGMSSIRQTTLVSHGRVQDGEEDLPSSKSF